VNLAARLGHLGPEYSRKFAIGQRSPPFLASRGAGGPRGDRRRCEAEPTKW
jgi:hypothetical protein